MSQKCMGNDKCPNLNICSESQMCMYHCDHNNHNHCTYIFCGDIDTCNKGQLCKQHCMRYYHDHCNDYFCNSTEDLCDETSKCRLHCKTTSHGHCVSTQCNKLLIFCDDLCPETEDTCLECCDDQDHDHCEYKCKNTNICDYWHGIKLCVNCCDRTDHSEYSCHN